MPSLKNNARTLIDKLWGSNWIDSIPAGWRDSLKIKTTKTPGVPNGTDPDAITGDVITSQTTTNRTSEVEKETTELEAVLSDKIEHEQDYDQKFDVVIPKTKYLTLDNAEVGMPRRNIRAFNPKVSEVETIDPTALFAVFSTYIVSFPGTANLNSRLPDVLSAIVGVVETTQGDGDYTEDGLAYWDVRGSAALSIKGTGQASGAVIPEASPTLISPFSPAVPTTRHVFLLQMPVTRAQVLVQLSKLTTTATVITVTIASPGVVTWTAHGFANGDTVIFTTTGALPTGLSANTIYYVVSAAANTFQVSLTSGGAAINTTGSQSGAHSGYRGIKDWPKFNPTPLTIINVGRRASLQANATSNWQDGGGDGGADEHSESAGTGTSKELGLSVRVTRIPFCLHGAFSGAFISGTHDTITITTSAHAEADASVNADTGNITEDIEGYSYVQSIAATTPTSIPSTGLYLLECQGEPYAYGYAMIHAEVVNLADR